jgi:site-specific recombinase XerD
VAEYIESRAEEVKPGTVAKEMSVLKHCLRLAVEWGELNQNPAAGARLPDVDLNAKQVVLRHTKNGEERVAYINALAMRVFQSMNLSIRKQRGDRGVLWPHVTPEQVSMRFIRAARLAGAPEGTSFHTLRHTYATQLKLAGRDLDDIRRLLGHGDLRMTQRYAKITDPHLAKAADALDGVLNLPMTT